MNFDDLKERILSSLKQTWERIQESSAYNHLRDRFENLTPRGQKAVLAAAVFIFGFLIFSMPYGYWSESQTSVKGFEDRRDIVRRLLKASRESADVPDIPQAPAPEALRTQIENYLREVQLIPEQIKSVEVIPVDSKLIPADMAQGSVAVNLAKLNLRQVLDIGYKLKALSPSVKMTGMQMFPDKQDARYFDVVFKLVSLAVPQVAPPPIPEPEAPPKKPSFRKGTSNKEKINEGDE